MAHEHVERHFTAGLVVRDAVIGMADGLTVPFALAAGLTGAIDTTWIIVVAGLAEIVAGSIAMGLGGFIPLLPYMLLKQAVTALVISSVVTVVALAVFGYVKGHFTGAGPARSAMQTVLIGGLAAGAAFLIARAIS